MIVLLYINMKELMKNQIVKATVDAYSSEAYGVCRVEGRAVFVPRALVGEEWELRIVKVNSSVVYARGERLLKASPLRLEPDCPCYGLCGGCDTQHMSYEEELRFKLRRVNDALVHIGKQQLQTEEILGSEKLSSYRNKAIFALAEVGGEPRYGFFKERSHELIPVENCLLQSELSCRAAAAVTDFLRSHKLSAYDEKSGQGTVRHVFCRQARCSADAVVCVVSARGFGALTGALTEHLHRACPELTGIVLNINKTSGNTVLAGKFYTLWGRDAIEDELCGLRFSISPQAFFQVNPPQAEKLYARAAEYAAADRAQLVLDLYCGAGTISLVLAGRAGHVIGAEVVPQAVENARENARRNKIGNAEFICADAAKAAQTLAQRALRPDAVVVDPPRKGLDEAVIEAIGAMAPPRVVYVSCNPSTLARDILRFNAFGYALEAVTVVDMFPRTAHVETVCLLASDFDKQNERIL